MPWHKSLTINSTGTHAARGAGHFKIGATTPFSTQRSAEVCISSLQPDLLLIDSHVYNAILRLLARLFSSPDRPDAVATLSRRSPLKNILRAIARNGEHACELMSLFEGNLLHLEGGQVLCLAPDCLRITSAMYGHIFAPVAFKQSLRYRARCRRFLPYS